MLCVQLWRTLLLLTLRFSLSLSLRVSVSALAMTGTTLTLLWMAFMNWTSRGFRLVGLKNENKYKHKLRLTELNMVILTVKTFCHWKVWSIRDCKNTPVAKRGDKIETAVNSVVHNVSTIQAAFIVEVALELVIDVTDDGAETGRKIKHVNRKHQAHPNSNTPP